MFVVLNFKLYGADLMRYVIEEIKRIVVLGIVTLIACCTASTLY